MAFNPQGPGRGGQSAPLAEINMVPLIDVMLVLVVIFIVTAPLTTHSVKLNLPQASTQRIENPVKVDLSIDAFGQRFWNGKQVSRDEAATQFAEAARMDPVPVIEVRGDEESAYRYFAETMADASRAGLSKIVIVTQPKPGS